MACDLTTIQTDACTSSIGKVTSTIKLLQIIAQLTCEAAEASAAAMGDMRAANYGGVAPVWVPAGTLGVAVDTVTERIWWYYSGAWR